jgi:hypothetical protein
VTADGPGTRRASRRHHHPPPSPATLGQVEAIARAFHENYERLAPEFGWKPQPQSSVSWERVPPENRQLMQATVRSLLIDGIIEVGSA